MIWSAFSSVPKRMWAPPSVIRVICKSGLAQLAHRDRRIGVRREFGSQHRRGRGLQKLSSIHVRLLIGIIYPINPPAAVRSRV